MKLNILLLAASIPAAAPFLCGTLTCDGTSVSGKDNVAIGQATQAIGVQGDTAMGFHTTASGSFSTAMGYGCTASALYSTAMGASVEATESESLAVSGNVHSKNAFLHADERLVTGVTDVDTDGSLEAILGLRVVSSRPSEAHCKHMNKTETECENNARSVGLLGQQVQETMPEAVSSGTSMKLVGSDESIDNVVGLNVHAMLANLVGGMQAQAREIEELKALVKEQSVEIEALRK
ncbi:hypothetical protein TrVE_jg6129 [Triparma verrucosa]|uniref:Peptidase S74 domain-containing protein n=1 Tax=Triparma verrucosa TaxID=1606542 RepID=A0A9W7F1N1_9STRA|nr:hypothetical protein TrVE_jg6129 [Triparma verrucosa]